MKLQTKISILIVVVVLFFATTLFLIQFAEQQKTREILKLRKIEQQESFKRAIKSFEHSLEVFSKDYTQWTEMVDFVYSGDSAWAFENIDYSLNTYNANVVWVYKSDLSFLYSANSLSTNLIDTLPLNYSQRKKVISQSIFSHFFIVIDTMLIEVRGAPIQPSSDLDRTTIPVGYFFAGRLWSSNYVDELGIQTSSKVKITDVENKSLLSQNSSDDFKIVVEEKLPDWDNKPIKNIISISDYSILKISTEVFNEQLIALVLFSIAVLGIVSFFLIKYVSNPLKSISNGLKNQNSALLTDLAQDKAEFGELSKLIIQFFNQKEQLIDEEKQRRFVETSLTKSEEKYKKIFDNIQDVFFQTDLDGTIVSVSPSIERYSEYKRSEIMGKKITDYYLDPSVRHRFLDSLKQLGEVTDFEIFFVKKSGRIIPCSVNAHFIFDENKKLVGIEGSLRDISERKKNEEQILKLSRAIEQSPVSVIITDIVGNVEYVNPKFIEISGYSYDDIRNQNVDVLKSGLMSDKVYDELWNNISKGNEWRGELLNRKKNGELYWENVFITPIKNPENIVTNFLALKEDITEKKKIIEELKTAKEKAEEMNNLKSSFLANMSHELRTPMMGILGNAEIISISTEDDEIKDMASAIYQSGRRLINALNLILDLSRIEANKDNIDVEKLDVVPIIEDVVDHFTSAAKQKGLSLNFTSDVKSINSYLDERLFREVLNNLINNAIKFTNLGGISVSLTAENEKMIIKVLDTGIGIPKHSLGLIFEEFRQVSEGYGRSFEGTGLGLTITKKFVEKLNGKISVKSILDEGSEFTIEFPIVKE